MIVLNFDSLYGHLRFVLKIAVLKQKKSYCHDDGAILRIGFGDFWRIHINHIELMGLLLRTNHVLKFHGKTCLG